MTNEGKGLFCSHIRMRRLFLRQTCKASKHDVTYSYTYRYSNNNYSNSNLHKLPHLFITFNLNTCKTVFQMAHEGTQGQRWVVSKLLFAVWWKC